MGTSSCKQDCCFQNDSDKGASDFVGLKPTNSAPGFDTRKPAPPPPEAARVSTDENVAKSVDSAYPAMTEITQTTVAPWPRAGDGKIPNIADVHETYDDGSTYDGQIVGGERHGEGLWKSAQETYEGQWKQDHRHGKGKQTWEDGRVYAGQFADGKFHGFGRMEWTTPQGLMAYEGDYVDDVKHGHGKYLWPDGRVYDGQWVDGARSGKATLVNPRGEKRQGIWHEDKLQRWVDEGDELQPAPNS